MSVKNQVTVRKNAAYKTLRPREHRSIIQGESPDKRRHYTINFDRETIVEVTDGRYIDKYCFDEYVGAIEIMLNDSEYLVYPSQHLILEKIGL